MKYKIDEGTEVKIEMCCGIEPDICLDRGRWMIGCFSRAASKSSTHFTQWHKTLADAIQHWNKQVRENWK